MIIKAADYSTLEACWIHHIGKKVGAHADGNHTRVGSNIMIRGNNFDLPIDIGAPYKSAACGMNQASLGDVDNMVMDGNWLNGGGYTVYFENIKPYSQDYWVRNCQLTNNYFGRDYRFGPLRVAGQVTNLTVDGNVWEDTGEWMDINDQY